MDTQDVLTPPHGWKRIYDYNVCKCGMVFKVIFINNAMQIKSCENACIYALSVQIVRPCFVVDALENITPIQKNCIYLVHVHMYFIACTHTTH